MDGSMRVAMYYNNADVRVESQPIPKLGPGEMLVRVRASGICGSDVMFWYRRHKVPLVLGHEIAGEIVQLGPGVEGWQVGERVAASHHVPCNTCHYCRRGMQTTCDTIRSTTFDPGGFSEYVRLPAINVDRGTYRLPESVSFEEGTFAEPVACALHGNRRSQMQIGDTVLVLGSGIAGLLHIHCARALGAGLIVATDINDYRLSTAMNFGADHALSADQLTPELLRELNNGLLADVVIICASATSVFEQALQCLERGGTLLVFAPTGPDVKLPLDFNEIFWRTQRTITTSYAGAPADHIRALELIRAGSLRVSEMITHRLPLERSQEGFGLVERGDESIKVIIEP
ncbi:MAG: zinc-dependent dehydrogenase [Candidatus Alcyoniella australis]|nr:zinc-dependent dehydrogenase [Candidatus Alcyoniella australis]